MNENGYDYFITDELGGVHTDGVGYAPDGHFCGECTRDTCDSCQAWLNNSNGKALADAIKSIDVSMYEHWVNCSECIYFDECEIKEDRDGCLAGEMEEEE